MVLKCFRGSRIFAFVSLTCTRVFVSFCFFNLYTGFCFLLFVRLSVCTVCLSVANCISETSEAKLSYLTRWLPQSWECITFFYFIFYTLSEVIQQYAKNTQITQSSGLVSRLAQDHQRHVDINISWTASVFLRKVRGVVVSSLCHQEGTWCSGELSVPSGRSVV